MLPNQPVASAYMELRNASAAPDTLLSASSPEAGRIELHTMTMDGDVMKMRPVEGGIAVPAGGSARLAPGGLHMMLQDPARVFAAGETVPVTLNFEHAGTVEVAFPVVADVSMAEAVGGHGGMPHAAAGHGAHDMNAAHEVGGQAAAGR